MPVYNTELYLKKSIDSILAQSYSNFELLIIDDGSGDNSGRICDGYAKKDSRVIVLHTENNGQSHARNTGLKIARGDFIGFVDSDDYIDIDYFEVLASYLLKNVNVDCVGLDMVGDASSVQKKFKIINREEAICEVMAGNLWSVVWNKVYRVECLNGIYFPEGQVHEEIEFNHKYLMKIKKFGVLNYKGYHYTRERIGDTKGTFQMSRLRSFNQLVTFISDLDQNGLKKARNALILFALTHFIEMYYSAFRTNQNANTMESINKYFKYFFKMSLLKGIVLIKPKILIEIIKFYFYQINKDSQG